MYFIYSWDISESDLFGPFDNVEDARICLEDDRANNYQGEGRFLEQVVIIGPLPIAYAFIGGEVIKPLPTNHNTTITGPLKLLEVGESYTFPQYLAKRARRTAGNLYQVDKSRHYTCKTQADGSFKVTRDK